MVSLLCLFTLIAVSTADFSNLLGSKVCYDLVGCFDNTGPFTNSWHQLPDSPKDVGVTFTLYTRADPASSAVSGQTLDFKNATSVLASRFQLQAATKFIIHGYMDDGSEKWIANMKDTLLQAGDFNVIKVSWGPGAKVLYPKSVANTRVVGAVVAHFLLSLRQDVNVSLDNVHLLGHSLGAHIAGIAGSIARGIARISGLDPAGPMFESTDPAVRIDPSDADFVDCIHTDGLPMDDLGFGTKSAWCDADFYPNGGGQQPGCSPPISGVLTNMLSLHVDAAEGALSCSHSRSHELYTQSILRCSYPSTHCDSFPDFTAGKCSPVCRSTSSAVLTHGPCPNMGYHSDAFGPQGIRPKGKYYLNTTATMPFC